MEMKEKSFFEQHKFTIIGAIVAIIVGALAFIFMMKSGDTGDVSGNAKQDNSKKVKSTVGDTKLGDGAMQLEGISVGGNIGQIGSNTKTESKTDTSKSEETYEGN